VSRPQAGEPERGSSLFSERFLRKWFAQTAGEAGRQANPQRKKALLERL
jgi:hypothetical protein